MGGNRDDLALFRAINKRYRAIARGRIDCHTRGIGTHLFAAKTLAEIGMLTNTLAEIGMLMNMNQITRAVTMLEGGKKNLNIADVKETLRCLRDVCDDSLAATLATFAYLGRYKVVVKRKRAKRK